MKDVKKEEGKKIPPKEKNKKKTLGPGPGKSAQCEELPFNGYSPGCSQLRLLSGWTSAW